MQATTDSELFQRLCAAFGDTGPLARALADVAAVSSHAAGDLVREAGAAPDSAVLVLSGALRDLDDPGLVIGAGALLDLADALAGAPAGGALVARAPCVVARIGVAELEAVAGSGGPAAVTLLRALARSARRDAAAEQGAREETRVITEILRRARPDAGSIDSWLVDPMPRHRDLAADLSVSEERVAGAVARLMRDGIARRRLAALEILDRAAARRLVGAPV